MTQKKVPAPPPGFELVEPNRDKILSPPAGFEMLDDEVDGSPAPAPSPAPSSTPVADTVATGVGGFLEGIPVVGPMIRGGVERAAAATDAAFSDRTYAGNMEFLNRDNARLKQEHPTLDTAAQITGAIGGTIPMVMAAPAAFGASKAPMLLRMGASGLTGAALGGADAAVRSGGDIEATKGGALWGGGLGVAGPPVAAGVGKVAGAIANRVGGGTSVPTISQMDTAKRAAYKAVDRLGARYAASAVDDMVDDIATKVRTSNINPSRHPRATSMLAEIEGMKGREMSLTELDQLRQVINRDVGKAPDAAERFFGKKMVSALDAFIDGADDTMMVGGKSGEASKAITTARALNTKLRKAETVADALKRAERGAARSGSGGNLDNQIRQKVSALLDNPKKAASFSAEEREIMEKIVRGTKGQNVLRLLGKLSPQGSGLMAALGLGATAANPLMAIPSAAGLVAKPLAEGATKSRAAVLNALIRTGQMPGASPLALAAGKNTEAVTRALMAPTVPSTVRHQRRQSPGR
jgi:hypothetical protein